MVSSGLCLEVIEYMSLESIRNSIAADCGYHPDSSDEDKQLLNREINEIAFDVFHKNDLVGSIWELIAFYDVASHLISLPWYVGDVRGGRYYDTPAQITLRDIRPRYSTQGFSMNIMDFREVGVSSLWIQPENYSNLTFSYPEGEVEDFDLTIAVVGETPVASNKEEQLVITAGQSSATTANNFIGAPRIIQKARANSFDITVTDVEENELAIIPNGELKSQYGIWQVADDNIGSTLAPLNAIELLYKERYRKMVNDYDSILNERYDDVIKWKFMEEYYSKQEGKELMVEKARMHWIEKMGGQNHSKAKGKKAELQTVPNKFYNMFRPSYRR
jgi:hypothetical protein